MLLTWYLPDLERRIGANRNIALCGNGLVNGDMVFKFRKRISVFHFFSAETRRMLVCLIFGADPGT